MSGLPPAGRAGKHFGKSFFRSSCHRLSFDNLSMRGMIAAVPLSFRAARILKCFAVALGFAVAAFAAWQAWLSHGGVFSTARFDVEERVAPPDDDARQACDRGGMARHIHARLPSEESPREQARALLGKPSRHEPAGEQHLPGICGRLRMDLETLDVAAIPSPAAPAR